jgi:hypothetical protein
MVAFLALLLQIEPVASKKIEISINLMVHQAVWDAHESGKRSEEAFRKLGGLIELELSRSTKREIVVKVEGVKTSPRLTKDEIKRHLQLYKMKPDERTLKDALDDEEKAEYKSEDHPAWKARWAWIHNQCRYERACPITVFVAKQMTGCEPRAIGSIGCAAPPTQEQGKKWRYGRGVFVDFGKPYSGRDGQNKHTWRQLARAIAHEILHCAGVGHNGITRTVIGLTNSTDGKLDFLMAAGVPLEAENPDDYGESLSPPVLQEEAEALVGITMEPQVQQKLVTQTACAQRRYYQDLIRNIRIEGGQAMYTKLGVAFDAIADYILKSPRRKPGDRSGPAETREDFECRVEKKLFEPCQ